jgi:hypothetical protein
MNNLKLYGERTENSPLNQVGIFENEPTSWRTITCFIFVKEPLPGKPILHDGMVNNV